jgi:hypothetical protein
VLPQLSGIKLIPAEKRANPLAASNEFLVSSKKVPLAAGANANNAETSPFN